eukprot:6955762-Alexandrium_andersonii.AAC.1
MAARHVAAHPAKHRRARAHRLPPFCSCGDMALRQDLSTSTEHEEHGTMTSPDADLARPYSPADTDADVLAEWDRKGR